MENLQAYLEALLHEHNGYIAQNKPDRARQVLEQIEAHGSTLAELDAATAAVDVADEPIADEQPTPDVDPDAGDGTPPPAGGQKPPLTEAPKGRAKRK